MCVIVVCAAIHHEVPRPHPAPSEDAEPPGLYFFDGFGIGSKIKQAACCILLRDI
jgi:hypothetical protein